MLKADVVTMESRSDSIVARSCEGWPHGTLRDAVGMPGQALQIYWIYHNFWVIRPKAFADLQFARIVL